MEFAETRPMLRHSPPSDATISIVVPVFNEEEVVGVFLDAIERVARDVIDRFEQVAHFEIVFVDDGSADRTSACILSRTSNVLDLRLVKLSRNFRKDNALAAGLAHATGDAVIPMDVDLQDPPEFVAKMVEAWIGGAKVVNSRRVSRERDSYLKRTTSNMFYKVFNRLSDYPVEPNVGDFRLFDRKVVDVLNQMPERVRFMKGIFAWVGFEAVTLEYERAARVAGTTKWNYWKLWNFALDGLTGSTTLPIRAWSYIGFSIALLSLAFAVVLILRTLFLGIDVPGYASLMVVTLFLGACNLMALGVMGEYVGRLTVEAKGRPIFVVDQVFAYRRGSGWDAQAEFGGYRRIAAVDGESAD